MINKFVNELDIALKTLSYKKSGTDRDYPADKESNDVNLSESEKKLSEALMRVNLAGEVAAQALYRGQAMVCKDPEIKEHLIHAGDEETDHLIWCKKRLDELDGKPSILNPIWYAGSFAIGAIFGSLGEKTSLGFVEETEKQVVKHLQRHLDSRKSTKPLTKGSSGPIITSSILFEIQKSETSSLLVISKEIFSIFSSRKVPAFPGAT